MWKWWRWSETIWIGIFYWWKNQKFDKHIWNFGLSSDNLEFLDFLQSDFCKEILEATTLKFILKLVIFATKISTLTIRFLNSQQNSSKGDIKLDFI